MSNRLNQQCKNRHDEIDAVFDHELYALNNPITIFVLIWTRMSRRHRGNLVT